MKATTIIGILISIILSFGSNAYTASSNPVDTTVINSLDSYSRSVYELTNEYRKSNGMNKLFLSDKLTEAAKNKANDLCINKYWSHELSDGRKWETFIDDTGLEYQIAGENLGKGFTDTAVLMQAWIDSPTHKDNLDGDYTHIGVGYAECGGKLLVAQEFAR